MRISGVLIHKVLYLYTLAFVPHSLTQSTSEQCNIHTSTGVSPTNFDMIYFYFYLKILLIQWYLTHWYPLQTY